MFFLYGKYKNIPYSENQKTVEDDIKTKIRVLDVVTKQIVVLELFESLIQ